MADQRVRKILRGGGDYKNDTWNLSSKSTSSLKSGAGEGRAIPTSRSSSATTAETQTTAVAATPGPTGTSYSRGSGVKSSNSSDHLHLNIPWPDRQAKAYATVVLDGGRAVILDPAGVSRHPAGCSSKKPPAKGKHERPGQQRLHSKVVELMKSKGVATQPEYSQWQRTRPPRYPGLQDDEQNETNMHMGCAESKPFTTDRRPTSRTEVALESLLARSAGPGATPGASRLPRDPEKTLKTAGELARHNAVHAQGQVKEARIQALGTQITWIKDAVQTAESRLEVLRDATLENWKDVTAMEAENHARCMAMLEPDRDLDAKLEANKIGVRIVAKLRAKLERDKKQLDKDVQVPLDECAKLDEMMKMKRKEIADLRLFQEKLHSENSKRIVELLRKVDAAKLAEQADLNQMRTVVALEMQLSREKVRSHGFLPPIEMSPANKDKQKKGAPDLHNMVVSKTHQKLRADHKLLYRNKLKLREEIQQVDKHVQLLKAQLKELQVRQQRQPFTGTGSSTTPPPVKLDIDKYPPSFI